VGGIQSTLTNQSSFFLRTDQPDDRLVIRAKWSIGWLIINPLFSKRCDTDSSESSRRYHQSGLRSGKYFFHSPRKTVRRFSQWLELVRYPPRPAWLFHSHGKRNSLPRANNLPDFRPVLLLTVGGVWRAPWLEQRIDPPSWAGLERESLQSGWPWGVSCTPC